MKYKLEIKKIMHRFTILRNICIAEHKILYQHSIIYPEAARSDKKCDPICKNLTITYFIFQEIPDLNIQDTVASRSLSA